MRRPYTPWTAICVVGGAAVGVALIWLNRRWPLGLPASDLSVGLPFLAGEAGSELHPWKELLKLVSAALVGTAVTAVHRLHPGDKPLGRSLQQAQILICVSGAMMMIIIGNSLARALGIAGGASIIRFRTPVEDPKDTTVLFLLLGLGMACGLGAIGVAFLGAIFLCLFLVVLDRFGERKPRNLLLELVADGPEFPTAHVHDIFQRCGVRSFEPRELSHGDQAVIKYQVSLEPRTSISQLSTELMNGGTSGIRSVAWQAAKKRAQVA